MVTLDFGLNEILYPLNMFRAVFNLKTLCINLGFNAWRWNLLDSFDTRKCDRI